MEERIYGGNKPSYGAKKLEDGTIEVRVYHSNKGTRALLEKHKENPSYFLERYSAFKDSGTMAEKWLAKVMEDFRVEFERNQVRIII